MTQPLHFTRFVVSKPKPGLDAVPFIDLLLIVFFAALNTSAFITAPGTVIQLPRSRSLEVLQIAPTAVLTVDRNQLYFFDGAKLSPATLQARLANFVDSSPRGAGEAGAILLIKADSSITTDTLFGLMDMARQAGFAQVHLAAEPPPDTRSQGWEALR